MDDDSQNDVAGGKSWVPEPAPVAEPLSAGRRIGALLVVLALVGTVAAYLIPALAAGAPRANESLGTDLLGFLLWPYVLARLLRWNRAWSYPIFGLIAFFGITVLSGAMSGLEKRRELAGLEQRLIASLEKFDPPLAAEARRAGKNQAAMSKVLVPAFRRASQTASDSALIGVVDSQIRIVDTGSGINLPRCLAAFNGTPAPAATRAEVDATVEPMIAVFESAARNRAAVQSIDMARVEQLLMSIYTKIDPEGVLQDNAKLSALSQPAQCDLYLRYLRAIRSLPRSDAGLVLRYNAGAGR